MVRTEIPAVPSVDSPVPPAECLAGVDLGSAVGRVGLGVACRSGVFRVSYGALRRLLEAYVRLRCPLRDVLPVEHPAVCAPALDFEFCSVLAGLQVEGTGGDAAGGAGLL